MDFISLLVRAVIWTVIAFVLTPRPKVEQPQARGIEDFNIPDAKEGTEIGRVYGTVWIKGAHVAWYGDFATEAIRSDGGGKK